MKIVSTLLALVLAVPALASSQTLDAANDLTGYRRFVVYPHLESGLAAVKRGDRDRALTELEQARRLAPESPTVALHLAAAYRTFGDTSRAVTVLRDQLNRTPNDGRLRAALADAASTLPAKSSAPAGSCAGRTDASCGAASSSNRAAGSPAVNTARRDGATATGAPAATSPRPRPSNPDPVSAHPGVSASRRTSAATSPQPASDSSPKDVSTDAAASLALALQARRFDAAERLAESLIAHDSGRAGVFDETTYKLVDGGATEQALRILLRAYPFATAGPAERDMLFNRTALLVEQQRSSLTADQLQPLRVPLNTPSLRRRQAVLWTTLQDCSAVRAVLADESPEYGHDDWLRLGDCSNQVDPALARAAYARAHALEPGERGSRALAYSAHASGDYQTALNAWRIVDADRLQGDDLMAAVTTALAAGDRVQAAAWLDRYRERGEALGAKYWSLLGQTRAEDAAGAAVEAFEHAVALHPDVDDYRRLAQLDRAPGREVHWLERAADLDPASAALQQQLAYACTRAGRTTSALRALERAAALDPDNAKVQAELGFAHSRAGHPALAERALERAWRADPNNLVVAQQLVFVAQRLKQNDKARWYAERVLDAPAAFSETAGREDGLTADDRRFGFQRLHEDLGRRVTVNLDGFSGTRVGTAATASPAGSHYRSYSQLEADVRLGNPAVRDGSTLSAYARVLGDSGAERSALPAHDTMLGAGLRWKPWRSQVIYLAAENQIGLEDHNRTDVLLRASASFFNGGRYSDDWHPARAGWMSRNLYIDAADYLKADYRAFTADYRTSYHRAISTEQTVEPYGHVQFTGAKDSAFHRDVRAGAGLRWNLWYGATTYDAPRRKLSLGIEFQQALETYLPDRNGMFVTLGTRW